MRFAVMNTAASRAAHTLGSPHVSLAGHAAYFRAARVHVGAHTARSNAHDTDPIAFHAPLQRASIAGVAPAPASYGLCFLRRPNSKTKTTGASGSPDRERDATLFRRVSHGQHITLKTGTGRVKTTAIEECNDLVIRAWEMRAGERAGLLAEAQAPAGGVNKRVEKQAEEMMIRSETARAALDEEKLAKVKAHSFQKRRIILNVGGHRFETSLQTLTCIPDSSLASMFTGRDSLAPDAEGEHFIDRDGIYFHHILNFLRDRGSFKLSSDVTEGQKDEIAAELRFYGMLDHMMPYLRTELGSRSIAQRTCCVGTAVESQTTMAHARVLSFDVMSTTPFFAHEFQNLRFVITDRVINNSPVWAEVGGVWFMYRNLDAFMMIGGDPIYAKGRTWVEDAPQR